MFDVSFYIFIRKILIYRISEKVGNNWKTLLLLILGRKSCFLKWSARSKTSSLIFDIRKKIICFEKILICKFFVLLRALLHFKFLQYLNLLSTYLEILNFWLFHLPLRNLQLYQHLYNSINNNQQLKQFQFCIQNSICTVFLLLK